MIVKLLTEHHLEFLSLKGGCTGQSESTLVKMPHCWKSHVMALSSYVFLLTVLGQYGLYELYFETSSLYSLASGTLSMKCNANKLGPIVGIF